MNPRPAPAPATTSGFTIVEMVVSTAVFSTALLVLFGFMDGGFAASTSSVTMARLSEEGDRALGEVLTELRTAQGTALVEVNAPLSVRSVSYRHPTGVTNGAIVWGGLRTLAFEYDPGDPDDGLDNNGNGLIDEGRLVLRTQVGEPDERMRVIVSGVPEFLQGEVMDGVDNNANQLENEAGFCLDHDAATGTWRIHLTLARRSTVGGWSWRTFETSLVPRN